MPHVIWISLECLFGVALEFIGNVCAPGTWLQYAAMLVGKLPVAIHSWYLSKILTNHKCDLEESMKGLRDNYLDLFKSRKYLSTENIDISDIEFRLFVPKSRGLQYCEIPGCYNISWKRAGRKVVLPLKASVENCIVSAAYEEEAMVCCSGTNCLGEIFTHELQKHSIRQSTEFAVAFPIKNVASCPCVVLFHFHRILWKDDHIVSSEGFQNAMKRFAEDIHLHYVVIKNGKV